ncbi:hypothetical protein [Streptomyces melanogenes]|uniref:Uncharacterized protein n=1 Tax=Streptomyces melanogenes TaxID=67326 RepID=A0ABZ1XBG5_9ACTN|nr:hypothetical protein [Streptomyces melanogenes]
MGHGGHGGAAAQIVPACSAASDAEALRSSVLGAVLVVPSEGAGDAQKTLAQLLQVGGEFGGPVDRPVEPEVDGEELLADVVGVVGGQVEDAGVVVEGADAAGQGVVRARTVAASAGTEAWKV